MKKIVIAGNAKLQNEVNKWLKVFESKEYKILDYPRAIEKAKLEYEKYQIKELSPI